MLALTSSLKLVDPFIVALTGVASYYLRFGELALPSSYVAAILAAFAMTFVMFEAFDVYRGRGMRNGVVNLMTAWLGVVVGLVVLMYMTKTGAEFSRQWLGMWSVLAFFVLIGARIAALWLLRVAYTRGGFGRRIAIAGAGVLGREVARRLKQSPSAGFNVVAFFDDDPALRGASVEGAPVHGAVDEIKAMVRSLPLDQVWIALPLRAEARIKLLLRDLAPMNVEVRFVPDIYGFTLLNHSVKEVSGLPVVNLTESPFTGLKGALKWLEDKLLALVILLVIWPVLLVVALGIKLTSPGPVLFRQRRGGLDNREIVVWKFRTMAVDQRPFPEGLPQARKDDPRVTRFGAFLRRTSLDELPQFINVLLGDMSIVGPRPHPLWLNEFYFDKIPTYMLRSWIKPGITGWAQVCGWRGETDETWKMEMRVQHDLYYIENWSLGLDIYIILLTLFRLRGPQAY
jgi:putative colanic acid biosynthesis UDP-glucose lipid carrier transferase